LDRLPGRVEQILVRALAIRQTQRFDTPTAFADALARASERGEKFDDDKVRDVLDRAAELDAEHAAHDEALSMGGVERVAAEVGISPERVREAAREVATPHTGIVRGGYLGVTGNIELERLVAGRVSRPQYGAMVEGIRQAVGEAGRINETFDESLFWEGRLVTASRRRVQVTVSPVGAESRIRITERIGEDLSASIASGVVGSLFVVLSGIALVVDGNVGLSAVLATIAVGQYTAVRALYHRYVKRRFRSLSALMQRLVQQATGSGARALPEGDHPPFQELVRPKG
jgi:hypothetical protein